MYDIDPILWHCHSMPEKSNGDHVLDRWFGNWLPSYFESYSIRWLRVRQQYYWSRHVMTIELQINHNELAITIIICAASNWCARALSQFSSFGWQKRARERECVGNLLWLLLSQPFIKPANHSFIHSFILSCSSACTNTSLFVQNDVAKVSYFTFQFQSFRHVLLLLLFLLRLWLKWHILIHMDEWITLTTINVFDHIGFGLLVLLC